MPELRVKGEVKQLLRLTTWFLITKIGGLVAALSVMALLIPWLASVFLLKDWTGELRLWLIATFSMELFGFLFIQLEALLLQRVVKWLNLAFSGVRLGLLAVAVLYGGFSLWNVILIDIISQGLVASFQRLCCTGKFIDYLWTRPYVVLKTTL